MHHFAVVDKTTNKVINKIVCVRGEDYPNQGDLTFIPLKDDYTIEIGHDWNEDQRWTGEQNANPIEQSTEEQGRDFLRARGMLGGVNSDSGSIGNSRE